MILHFVLGWRGRRLINVLSIYIYIVYSIILYLFPNVVFLEKDTLLPFYVWLFDLNIDYRIFTFIIVGWFQADLVNDVVSFVSILDLLLSLCSIDPWMSAERGFCKTLCLQMLVNQMSVILVYAFWSFVTIYFNFEYKYHFVCSYYSCYRYYLQG